jgi:hypothetical protein
MLGEDRVGMPMTVDNHLPDRYAIDKFAPPPPPTMKREPRKSRGLLAARVFRPPIPVEVITRPSRADEPGELQIEAIKGEGDLSGEVRSCAGPWQLESSWWSPSPVDREYWDVELARGKSYRMYRGEGKAEWYVDAGYE